MLNKKAFQEMRKHMDTYEKLREEFIGISRGVTKTSKHAIYAAHRDDLDGAKKLLDEAKANVIKINTLLTKDVNLALVGAYSEALEEYAEASIYIHFLKHKDIPTPKQLEIEAEVYLGALSDTVGELVRRAINSSIKGDFKASLDIKDAVAEIYAEMMLFDWRNTPVRKKFDAIKYGLEKLEDLALKIKFKQ